MGLFLLLPGAACGLLLLIVALWHARRREPRRVGFVATLLAFGAGALPLVAVIRNNFSELPLPIIRQLALLDAAFLLLLGLLALLLERYRGRAYGESRGLLAAGVGAFLAGAVYFAPLLYPPVPRPQLDLPTLAEAALPTATPTPVSPEERGQQIFNSVLALMSRETGLDRQEIVARFEDGQSVAQMVAQAGGDLEALVRDLVALAVEQTRYSLAIGEISEFDAGLRLSAAEIGIRLFLNGDFGNLDQIGAAIGVTGPTNDEIANYAESGDGTPASPQAATGSPETTPESPPSATPRALTATPPAAVPRSATPPPPTAIRTRARYASPTPSPTMTLPVQPCLALTRYNLNLRAEPRSEGELLLTIPYNTALPVLGRDEAATWWFVEYDDRAGWVDGAYLTLSDSCDAVPVR